MLVLGVVFIYILVVFIMLQFISLRYVHYFILYVYIFFSLKMKFLNANTSKKRYFLNDIHLKVSRYFLNSHKRLSRTKPAIRLIPMSKANNCDANSTQPLSLLSQQNFSLKDIKISISLESIGHTIVKAYHTIECFLLSHNFISPYNSFYSLCRAKDGSYEL